MRHREVARLLWFAVALAAGPALAEPPAAGSGTPARKEAGPKLEALKALGSARRAERPEDRPERRDDKDGRKGDHAHAHEGHKGPGEALKHLHGPAAERWRKHVESRLERRQEHKKRLIARWGQALRRPDAVAELRHHAERMARLRRLRFLAETEREGKDQEKLLARIDKLIELEQARHERAMQRHQTPPGAPSGAPSGVASAAAAPTPPAPASSGGRP